MQPQEFRTIGADIQNLLKLQHPPVAISFTNEVPQGLKKTKDNVAAGCVFWFKAFKDSFYTTREDHANCNIGSFTHGFVKPNEVSLDGCADINLMVGAEYLSLNDFGGVARMQEASKYVTYGPLKSTNHEPDVVLMVCNAEQAMLVGEAAGSYKTMGLPTCQGIPHAYNTNEVAVSLGCITNRVRTGMKPDEMVVTVPKKNLASFVQSLRARVAANNKVAQAVSAMLKQKH
jgi:uncharacterized protein (DUF169 family)